MKTSCIMFLEKKWHWHSSWWIKLVPPQMRQQAGSDRSWWLYQLYYFNFPLIQWDDHAVSTTSPFQRQLMVQAPRMHINFTLWPQWLFKRWTSARKRGRPKLDAFLFKHMHRWQISVQGSVETNSFGQYRSGERKALF